MHFKSAQNQESEKGKFMQRPVMAAAFTLCLTFYLTLSITCTSLPVQSADAAFNQAVQTFTSGKYSAALAQFQVVAQKYPSDPLTRYYMGLCYQQLNQVAQATQMYTWVEKYARSDKLKSQARAGLDSMNQYSAARTRPGSAPPPPPPPADGKAADGKSGDPKKAADAKPEPKGAMKCKKVIQFTSPSSNDQRSIQMFGPYWDSAREKFTGKVEFQLVDADSSSSADLVKKYGVSQFPHVVYLDKDGKVLGSNGPVSGDITSTIEGFK